MLTGVSLGELDQPVYPLNDIMPELADVAMTQILNKIPETEIVTQLIKWFANKQFQPASNFIVSEFIRQSIQNKGLIGIKDFCSDLQIHKSTLEKNFKHVTGYTPKEYARIIRFNFLLNRMFFSNLNLTQTSYEMGYFDQSHMIRDFKKITGTNPTDFADKKFSVPKLAAMAISTKQLNF